ncbi:gag-pol polyprotein [Artemisia annua]|uniref:Gag-pol polyprotein n=1 Tax=Artemisia annua TaxID=35608 RepID=A0A2U1M6S4_ARTAN|nr:gag-pol polyprotein [Artemisia annua]
MATCKNELKLDSSLVEQFQKFLIMYEKLEIFLDMLEKLKKFLAFQPHAMSTSFNKELASSFSKWILDSGATHHMSHLLSQFISLNLNSSKSILAANGNSIQGRIWLWALRATAQGQPKTRGINLPVHGIRNLRTGPDSMPLEGIGSVDTLSLALSNAYHIPSLTMNLASVSKICDSGYDVKFYVSDCSIYDRKTQNVVGTRHSILFMALSFRSRLWMPFTVFSIYSSIGKTRHA